MPHSFALNMYQLPKRTGLEGKVRWFFTARKYLLRKKYIWKKCIFKKSIFKIKYLQKLSKSCDDSIFPFREDRHPQANIESSPFLDNSFKETFF